MYDPRQTRVSAHTGQNRLISKKENSTYMNANSEGSDQPCADAQGWSWPSLFAYGNHIDCSCYTISTVKL